jgi:HPt (histidine-containing phosphotransfer) domain-containing protein
MGGQELPMALVDSAHFDADAFPLMDPSITEGLRAALGDGVDMIVAKTMGLIEDRLGTLDRLSATPLNEDMARTAHEIGGMAGQIGLTRLGKTALALERANKAGDAAATSALLGDVMEIAAQSKVRVTA